MIKRYKFEMGGMFVFYFGENLGKAILAFMKDRPTYYMDMVETITEEPLKEYERP